MITRHLKLSRLLLPMFQNNPLAKIKGLIKGVLDKGVSMAVETAIQKVCSVIDQKLREVYKNTVFLALIILGLNGCGVLMLYLPINETVSIYSASIFFLTAIIFGLVQFIVNLKQYGKTVLQVAQRVWSAKSLSHGIEDYVFSEFKHIAVIYAGIELASSYCSSLKKIPKFHETVKLIIRLFWKQCAIFGGSFVTYIVLIYGVIRPFILSHAGFTLPF